MYSTMTACQEQVGTGGVRPMSVGAQFRHARRSFDLTLDEIAEDIKIRPDLLRAIEEGNSQKIDEPMYRMLMVKTYAEYLGLSWDVLAREYSRESLYIPVNEQGREANNRRVRSSDLVVAPRLLKHILFSLSMIGICTYLMVLAAGALARPNLTVAHPFDNVSSSSKIISVEGAVSTDAYLSINGQEVLKNKEGNFRQMITLSEGVNTIRISASKKYSK